MASFFEKKIILLAHLKGQIQTRDNLTNKSLLGIPSDKLFRICLQKLSSWHFHSIRLTNKIFCHLSNSSFHLDGVKMACR